MLAKRIIPCLDVKNGRVVKGVNFRDLKDAGDPVETAAVYSSMGADEIVFLDITATIEKRGTMLDVVGRTSEKVFIPLTVGGGIKDIEAIRALLRSGADKVSINTAAVREPGFIEEAALRFGSQCIVVAIDAKKNPPGPEGDSWQVYINSGTIPTGIDAVDWARSAALHGAGEILLTSMDRDGTKDGYDLELTRTISRAVGIPVIASGGAGCPEHLFDAFTEGCADAALVASIFHYGEYTVAQAREYLRSRGIPMKD